MTNFGASMQGGNIIYEIRAEVRDDLCEAWESYMRTEHIPDVITAGGFVGATLERAADGRYRIRYVAPDRARLDQYIAAAAPALRQAALARFPQGVDLARAEWEVLAGW